MPMSSRPPPAWDQFTARSTLVRSFPNSARATRRSPRVPWDTADFRASMAGKKRVQMACRPEGRNQDMERKRKGSGHRNSPTSSSPIRGPILTGYPLLPSLLTRPLPLPSTAHQSLTCVLPSVSLPSPLLFIPMALTLALSFLIITLVSQYRGLNCVLPSSC